MADDGAILSANGKLRFGAQNRLVELALLSSVASIRQGGAFIYLAETKGYHSDLTGYLKIAC